MAFTHYQMASLPSFFNLPILSKNLTQTVTQKSRNHFLTRCEANNKVLQTDNRVAIYQKTLWSHDFINGLKTNSPINCKEKKEKAKGLEEKVREMIIDYEIGGSGTLKLLELIDNIERLGLGYRFQTDITRVLNKIATINENNLGLEDFYAVSLKFRILRQHGYRVSTEDFRGRFKDNNSGLIGCLEIDVKTLLSVYEASYLTLDGEIELNEAKLFSTENLMKLNGYENETMNDLVNYALDIPLYRRMVRLQARWYVDAYGKQKDANQLLLELARLDFNMVQSVHKTELQQVSKWWENIGLATKLSFIRDRLMEFFFWSVGVIFEPQYYSCRVGITKVCTLITTIDDIYDVYGSLDELKVFTNAVKRWDINSAEYMPEYLQLSFLALYNTVNEMGYDTLTEQGENIIPILAKVWGELMEAFFVEAKWTHSNYIPTLENYLDNAWRSVSGMVILTHGYFLINQDVKKDAIESLEKYHDLYKWSSMLFRLYNDLAISSDEIKRGKSANAILCYMHEHNVCEEVAREYIQTLTDKAWRKMIEARIVCSEDVMDPFVDITINLARVSKCTYQYGDDVKAPGARAKDRILSVIIEPISTIREKEHYYPL